MFMLTARDSKLKGKMVESDRKKMEASNSTCSISPRLTLSHKTKGVYF